MGVQVSKYHRSIDQKTAQWSRNTRRLLKSLKNLTPLISHLSKAHSLMKL